MASRLTKLLQRLTGRRSGANPSRPVVGTWLWLTPVVPLAAVIAYAVASTRPFLVVFAIGLLVSAAAGILGALVGFLFGLPRTAGGTPVAGQLSTNTNLDQVSDWLTKILVGLGLVQFGQIAGGMDSLAEAIAPGLGAAADAETFALALLVYSLSGGFLVGYLGTRIVITIRLKEVEDLLAAREEVLGTPAPEPPPPLPPQPPVAR